MKRLFPILALGAASVTGGCVNVTAPDKPIVINLNINVTQEVVYRLDGEAKTLIQQNPDIF
ncbi:MAG: YnbE family lipoprotein [Sphingomonas sp.]